MEKGLGKEISKEDIRIELPEKVRKIISRIEEAGYEAYAVGGCVRDSILGREPDDWDITTSAEPETVKGIFKRTVDTGIQHGTVTVMMDTDGFEVTTYRIDGEYEDSRHPKEVAFTSRLAEDLQRRDFTINAMAYSDRDGLADEFDGIGDIKRKLIRCVGEPKERFSEDALRMMRAVRFSAQLGYTIEEKTGSAVREMAGSLKNISAERIQTELVKLLISPHPDRLRCCYNMGITKEILPEFDACMETQQDNPHHCYSVGEHILHSLIEIPSDKVLRLAMLFHDIGKPLVKSIDEEGKGHFYGHAAVSADMARKILKRLKLDNDTISKVYRLVLLHDLEIEASVRGVRKAVNKAGEDIFPLLLQVKRADASAQSEYRKTEKLQKLKELKEIYKQVLNEQECVSLRTLAVTGRDLIEAGIKPGRRLGEILEMLLQTVLDKPECNTKETLLRFAAEWEQGDF